MILFCHEPSCADQDKKKYFIFKVQTRFNNKKKVILEGIVLQSHVSLYKMLSVILELFKLKTNF